MKNATNHHQAFKSKRFCAFGSSRAFGSRFDCVIHFFSIINIIKLTLTKFQMFMWTIGATVMLINWHYLILTTSLFNSIIKQFAVIKTGKLFLNIVYYIFLCMCESVNDWVVMLWPPHNNIVYYIFSACVCKKYVEYITYVHRMSACLRLCMSAT